jgi:hypothetical protein
MSDGVLDDAPFDEEDARRVGAWVDQVERALDLGGVPARTRHRLTAELQRDIDSARAAGADVGDLLHDDIAGFARELAEANGVPLDSKPTGTPASLGNIILTAVGGGVVGALASWFVIYPAVIAAAGRASDFAMAFTFYSIGATLIVLCALAAVRWRFREIPTVNGYTLVKIGFGFTLGGLAGIIPTALFAAATGYSSAGIVVLVEAAMVGLFCAAGISIIMRISRAKRSTAGHATI